MGKRSNFERKPRDYYPTPEEGALPLIPHLPAACTFVEPMAGDGRLIKHLRTATRKCVYACDLEPQADWIEKQDVLFFGFQPPPCDFIITNPPWERSILHRIIPDFTAHADTWLLFDADWAFTIQARPYRDLCTKFVAVGRISWMENGIDGMDNCAWYKFSRNKVAPTEFVFK